MRKIQDEHVPSELFSTSYLGPDGLSEEMVKYYLSKGQRLRAEYFLALLQRLGRAIKKNIGWTGKQIGKLTGRKQVTVNEPLPETSLGQTRCAVCKNK